MNLIPSWRRLWRGMVWGERQDDWEIEKRTRCDVACPSAQSIGVGALVHYLRGHIVDLYLNVSPRTPAPSPRQSNGTRRDVHRDYS